MPPVSVTIFASDAGNYFLEDDGVPGNNFSRIRFPDSTVVAFEHPTDDLFFAPTLLASFSRSTSPTRLAPADSRPAA
jgi:hypothetical protein